MEDMYKTRKEDGGGYEGKGFASGSKSEARGPVTSQSDRGDSELQDKEQVAGMKSQKRAKQKMRIERE